MGIRPYRVTKPTHFGVVAPWCVGLMALSPDAARLDVKGTTELFSLELDAKPGFRRAGLKARIDRLVDINRDLKAKGVSIEHFYDY